MTSINSSGPVGNIVNRLSSLKNISGRRVMPETDFLEGLEPPENDVQGTAQTLPEFSNFIPPAPNEPQEDRGGELTSQSYDVRANTVTPSDQTAEKSPGFWQNAGQWLGQIFKSEQPQPPSSYDEFMQRGGQPQQAPPQPVAQAGDDQVTPPPGFLQGAMEHVKKSFTPSLDASYEKNFPNEAANNAQYQAEKVNFPEMPPEQQEKPGFIQNAWNAVVEANTPKLTPEFANQFPEQAANNPQYQAQETERKQIDQQKLDEAQMNPYQVAAYGATDEFANRPELIQQFTTETGLPFDEYQKEMTEKAEKVIASMQDGNANQIATFDEQEKRLNDRIINGQATDMDKYYIGLALLMPLIIGGMFGKQAGLAALGGAAKGFGDSMGKRQESLRKDEELLADIKNKKLASTNKMNELQLDKLKIPGEIRKNAPKNPREDLKGMKIYNFKDPKTGEVIDEAYEVLPDLYMDLSRANTPEKRVKAESKASELGDEKAALNIANRATANVIKAAIQLKDPNLFGRMLALALSDDESGALKKLIDMNAPSIEIDGRMQNSAVYLNRQIEQMKDAYRRNELMKAFTKTIADHVGEMVSNPAYKGLTPQDLIDQVLTLRDRSQNFFVERVSSQGFIPGILENKFGEMNRQLYQSLNQKSDDKTLNSIKQKAHGTK